MTRIVSLVPSITELLHSLGLEEEVVGITKFCVHPSEWFRTKTRIGGTKNIQSDKIKALSPDLIIANKEENIKEQVEPLLRDYEVLLTDVNDFSQALDMITQVGRATGKEKESEALAEEIRKSFSPLRDGTGKTAAYLIWKEPWMTVGGDTFIHSMMQYAGFENVFADRSRYPQTSLEEIEKLKPQFVLLSSEPFPFKETHARQLQGVFSQSKILLVDGEMFGWYGSRMLHAATYFRQLRNFG
jgi:ABC-type Fe3+-hydroxamate transport system substrate-binding protein